MVHRCCISSCGMNVRVAEAKGLSYHCFPTNIPHREKWVKSVLPHLDKPDNFKVVQGYTRVCSRHFRMKDYSIDSKKRARLSSTAVPSVFPKKNSPLVLQNNIANVFRNKSQKAFRVTTNANEDEDNSSNNSQIPPSITISIQEHPHSHPHPQQVNSSEDKADGNILIESATLTDNHLILTVREDFSQQQDISFFANSSSITTLESSNSSTTFPLDQTSTIIPVVVKEENSTPLNPVKIESGSGSGSGEGKKRMRRKWNQSEKKNGCGPKNNKRKSSSSPGPTVEEDGEEPLNDDLNKLDVAGFDLSSLLSISTQFQRHLTIDTSGNKIVGIEIGAEEDTNKSTSLCLTPNSTLSVTTTTNSPTNNSSGSSPKKEIEFLNDNDNVKEINVNVIEQELLNSIQAVSITSAGDNTTTEPISLESHCHSAHQSSFHHHHLDSSKESHLTEIPLTFVAHDHDHDDDDEGNLNLSLKDESENLSSELEKVTFASLFPKEFRMEIEDLQLQNHSNFNYQLFSSIDNDFRNVLMISEDGDGGGGGGGGSRDEEPSSSCAQKNIFSVTESSSSSICGKSENDGAGGKKKECYKRSASQQHQLGKKKKMCGVIKRPKKERHCGKFTVERFQNSDKDIEYYTGFNSFISFEAFFNSVDTEGLKVTDVMYGVTDLIQKNLNRKEISPEVPDLSLLPNFSSPNAISGTSSSEKNGKGIVKRPKQGRLLSRMDELFMTIIRLKRRLPEKVLGHMFCISQPSASRIIRAWTMLLSKVLEFHPKSPASSNTSASPSNSTALPIKDEISLSIGEGKTKAENNYVNKNQRIPDSFRQLFQTDLAKSIINNVNVNSRKSSVGSTATAASSVSPKRSKKKKLSITTLDDFPANSPSVNNNNNKIIVPPDLDDQIDQIITNTFNLPHHHVSHEDLLLSNDLFVIEDLVV